MMHEARLGVPRPDQLRAQNARLVNTSIDSHRFFMPVALHIYLERDETGLLTFPCSTFRIKCFPAYDVSFSSHFIFWHFNQLFRLHIPGFSMRRRHSVPISP